MAKQKALELSIRIAGQMDKSLATAVSAAQNKISGLSQNLSRIGNVGLAAMGTLATGAVLAISNCTKTAADFENHMADVVKYVDGLADETGKISDKLAGNGQTYAENYGEMKKAILDLSTQIPYTAEDLTRLAAAAGQSGKGMEEITGEFLRDAAMWGKAMDISADQAGDWAAKWEQAFKMDHKEIMVLADQINYLGANSATTAAEIARAVNDAASLGQIGGVDVSTTAALADAMLATGVDSGKVGTSIKRTITNLSRGTSATKAMKEQWKELGLTAEGVAKSMQKDSIGTLQTVFSAIGDLPSERQVAALSTLFGQWAIEGNAKIVGNMDVFTDALKMVSDPSLYAGSMEREFTIKSETPEAIRQMRESAWQQLKIGVGDSFLPVQKQLDRAMRDLFVQLNQHMPTITKLADAFASLLSAGVEKAGTVMERAAPQIEKVLNYVADNGPQVISVLEKLVAVLAALKFAPAFEGLLGGAGNLLFGAKGGMPGGGKSGGLFGAVKGLYNSGRSAPGKAAEMAAPAAGWIKSFIGATGDHMPLAGKTGPMGFLSTAASALFEGGKDATANSGIGKYLSGVMHTKIGGGIGRGIGKTTGVAGEILSGISQATGLTDLVKNTGGIAKSGAGWLAGKAGALAPMAGKATASLGPLGGILSTGAEFMGSIWGPMMPAFGSLFSGAAPVVAAISGIIAVVSILGDHLEDIRGLVGSVFGDAGLAVFDGFIGKISSIGDFISGLFEDGGVAKALAPMQNAITGMFGEDAGAAFDGLVQILQSVMGVVGQLVAFSTGTVKPIIQDIFAFITGTVVPIVLQTFTAAAPAISSIISGLGTAIMAGMQIIGTAIQAAMPIVERLVTIFMGIANVVVPAVMAGFGAFSQGVGAIMTSIQGIFEGLIGFINGVFSGDWAQAWEGIKQIFSSAFGGLAELCKTPVNAVIAIINSAVSRINSLGLTIPEWVPGIGGNEFRINLPEIPALAKGGFTNGVSIAGEAGREAVISFQNSVRRQNIDTWMRAGRLLGVNREQAEISAGFGGAELKEIPTDAGSGTGAGSFTFAPQISIQGNADREMVESVLREAQARMEEWYNQMMRKHARMAY